MARVKFGFAHFFTHNLYDVPWIVYAKSISTRLRIINNGFISCSCDFSILDTKPCVFVVYKLLTQLIEPICKF